MSILLKVCGIIGYPLSHTLSPVMHEAAFEKLKLPFRYVPFEVPPQKLASAIQGVRALNFVGINVTIPHKQAVMEFIDEFDRHAQTIGAVNTIVNQNGKLIGYNTDATGFLKNLIEEGEFIPKGKRGVIFGAGGAGKAIACALAQAGMRRIVVVDIDKKRAKILGNQLKNQCGCDIAEYEAGEDRSIYWAIRESDILVNATPIGFKPHEAIPIMIKSLHKKLFIYDVVYADTQLIRTARKKGLQALNGLGMLVGQGAEAFKLWTKKKAPVEVMRKAVEKAIKNH